MGNCPPYLSIMGMLDKNLFYKKTIDLAGIPVEICCYSEKTFYYIERYMDFTEATGPIVSVSPEDIEWDGISQEELKTDPFKEYTYILLPVSERLLAFRRCIFHGAAFRWRDKAYIFAGPSGAGKTTQYINWCRLYPNEVSIINGDKCILEWKVDGSFWVHPSPWRGSECYGRNQSAQLAGIIYLEKDEKDQIRRMYPSEAVTLLYQQFFKLEETRESICNLFRMEEALLHHVPVWKLSNKGGSDAVSLTRRCIEEYEGRSDHEL